MEQYKTRNQRVSDKFQFAGAANKIILRAYSRFQSAICPILCNCFGYMAKKEPLIPLKTRKMGYTGYEKLHMP